MSNNQKLMIVGLAVLLVLFLGYFAFSSKENYSHQPQTRPMGLKNPTEGRMPQNQNVGNSQHLRDYEIIQSNDTSHQDNFDLIENEPEDDNQQQPQQNSQEPREFISSSSDSGDYEML